MHCQRRWSGLGSIPCTRDGFGFMALTGVYLGISGRHGSTWRCMLMDWEYGLNWVVGYTASGHDRAGL
jgi:hypothetical protein